MSNTAAAQTMGWRARDLREFEWQQILAQRAAHTIVGGDPLVPYDLIGMANEVVSLRQQLAGAVETLRALHEYVEATAPRDSMGVVLDADVANMLADADALLGAWS